MTENRGKQGTGNHAANTRRQNNSSESVPDGNPPWQWDLNPDGAVNLALNKTASQSSTANDPLEPLAGKAVDGNVSGEFSEASVAQTGASNGASNGSSNGANPWWQVDLGSVQAIGKIKIFNRTDCCPTLRKFTVLISDEPFGPSDPSDPAALASLKASAYPVDGPSVTLTTINAQRDGRYVRLQLDGPGPLSLAEVQVLAANK